ncbi:fimbrial biogenesis chaperone [Novilysobacter defluvii]|uniref:Pilus assembly protein PapD n=1 Tax=Lysobacter defluvii IMMIB APB-9 = DSM 18482 TaxID=1385515 RepID=A0A0A0M7Q8_9GAMM|nr:fimbria/pilus periplasmic chaperone [Lysobacter defluvii]KGO99120.1 pilus assembly protein PapD [Lysobacter defluvii IMMIB APB-9 = DSM 18482]
MKPFLARALLAATLLLTCSLPAMAGVIINGTRVVYPAQSREVTVQLTNTGDSPALVQAWIDSGDPDQAPEDSAAPFVITPPISRIEPGRGQALRIIFAGEPLPPDRESVYWLNVLEVPPAPDAGAEQNYLQVAFRSRVKLFYRPQGLPGTANEAPEALQWTGGAAVLQVTNPTPFHVTVVGLQARSADGTGLQTLEDKGRMLAPGESARWPVDGPVGQVAFTTVNDYGGRVEYTSAVEP